MIVWDFNLAFAVVAFTCFPIILMIFCITLTDFSGVQSISIDSSWFEQLGQPAGGVGVQPAGEGRVQDRGLEPPPPEQQLPSTRIHEMQNEANLKGFG